MKYIRNNIKINSPRGIWRIVCPTYIKSSECEDVLQTLKDFGTKQIPPNFPRGFFLIISMLLKFIQYYFVLFVICFISFTPETMFLWWFRAAQSTRQHDFFSSCFYISSSIEMNIVVEWIWNGVGFDFRIRFDSSFVFCVRCGNH